MVGRVSVAFDGAHTPAFIPVTDTAGTVTVPYSLQAVGGDEGVPFRVELLRCVAAGDGCSVVAYERTLTLYPGEGSVEIPYEELDANGDRVDVRFVSHGVDLQTTILRHSGVQGHYDGQVRVQQLGGAALGVGFELLVSPPSSSLANAQLAQVVWRAGSGPLDVPASDYPQGYRVDLTRQTLGGKSVWTGVAQYEVELSAPAAIPGISDPRLLLGSGHRSVIRSLRIELNATDGPVGGMFSDRYTGVVNLPSESGEISRLVAAGSGKLAVSLASVSTGSMKAPTPAAPLSVLQPVDLAPRTCQAAMTAAAGRSWAEICTMELDGIPAGDRDACSNVRTTAQFMAMSVETQRNCVSYLLACAEHEPSARTIFYDAWEADLQGATGAGAQFSSLLNDCRASHACTGGDCDTLNSCATSRLAECAREATAYTLFHAPQVTYRAEALRSGFLSLSAELSFGEQLAAYSSDTDLRLQWLKAQLAGDFSASAVRDAAEENLRRWNVQVLNPVRKSLLRLTDVYAMSVLTTLNGDHDREELEAWLVDMVSLWSKTVFDVAYFTERWSFALDTRATRKARYEYQQALLGDFYVSAIVLSELLNRVDASYLTAMLSGLSGLSTANQELLLSFEERVFARDAELFEDRSLMTAQGSSLPEMLASAARSTRDDINAANNDISRIISNAMQEAASDLEIKNRYDSELQSLFGELKAVCGNPKACSWEDFHRGRCVIPTGVEQCGMTPGSTASRAREVIESAIHDVLIAQNDLQSQQAREEIQWQQFRQLQARLGVMEDLHLLGYVATQEAVTAMVQLQEEGLSRLRRDADTAIDLRQSLAESVSDAVEQRLKIRLQERDLTQESFDNLQRIRLDAEQRQRDYIEEFERVSMDGMRSVLSSYDRGFELNQSALSATVTNIIANGVIDTAVAAIPNGVTDVGASVRAGMVYGKTVMNSSATMAQGMLSLQAQRVVQKAEADRALASLKLEVTRLREVSLPDLEDVRHVEEQRHALTMAMQTLGINEQIILGNLERNREDYALRQLVADQNSRIEEAELRARMERVELSQRERQAETNYRIMREEHALRAEAALAQLHREMTYMSGLELRVERAQLAVLQAVNELYSVSSRAGMLQERFEFIQSQYNSVTSLRRSPSLFFMRANEIRRAEEALTRARDVMTDLIVSAEYFAVRPFIQERIIANSSYSIAQIYKLHDEFANRLEYCGGPRTAGTEVLSLRRDVYGIRGPADDAVTRKQRSEMELFQAVLRQRNFNGYEPLLAAMRTTFGNVTSDLSRYYFLEIPISIDDFSILSQGCSARIDSMSLELIGDIQRQEGFAPFIHVITSESGDLRSCHLDIDDVVAPFAQKTNFGRVTRFSGPLRVGTLLANVNGGAVQAPYTGISGRPLAGKYLLVIDTQLSGNRGVSWDRLEDIVMTLHFTYQGYQVGESRCAP